MNPIDAKKLNDLIERIALSDKARGLDLAEVCNLESVTNLSNIYGKDNLMIARMIVQIRTHGLYKNSKLRKFYR